ncbi:hypothetical protein [Rufibacter sp. XAAS-G3-1]|uniref:hypothetical protein n=1 Tax=Rufibacter sp. XAAS-G3-1 TaxID=2729134 RepID=UPI0015E6FFA3|nr:hypothetical protein [Rufibacter sp. XAAS-G3-1]
MKKVLFIFSIVLLYLLIPFSILAILDIMVSQKYEVDQGRTFIDINDRLSDSERARAHKKIDKLEKNLNTQQTIYTVLLLSGLTIPTGMLIYNSKRKKRTTLPNIT